MKKILLTLAMALVTVYASAYFKVGDIYYQPDEQADDGTCWVRDSPYYGGYDGLTDITIPGRVTYNGREYRVTSIGSEAFKNVTTLQRVRLGWGVEEIGSSAFAGCTNLRYVFLPSTLTHIYNYAFQNCSSMTEMGVAAPTPPTLSSYALSGMRTCNVLTAIQTNASSYNAVSAWKAADSNGSVSYSGVKANDFVENGLCYVITSPSTMSNNVNVTLVGIQSGVTYLPMTSSAHDYTNSTYGGGSYIFCNWTEIAPYAAYNHSTLQKIGRSDVGSYFRLKEVGAYAFNSCHALTEVNISAETIGNYAFYNCSNLATVNLYLKDTENYGTQKLGVRCFANTAVSWVYIPQTLTYYGDGAFAQCSNLENINVSSNNTIFESFAGCNKSTYLKIPYGVWTIGDYAFYNTTLEELRIPSSATSVSTHAFSNMPSLSKLIFNRPSPPSGMDFSGIGSNCELSVPFNNVSAYSQNSVWSSAFATINGKAYDFAKADDSGNTTLYYTVTSVGTYTDAVASTLTFNGQVKIVRGEMYNPNTISIPIRYYSSNVDNYAITEIEDQAFSGTNLSAVYGGKCVKKIGERAFYYCFYLTTVNIPNPVHIGRSAFYFCDKLNSINMGSRLEFIGSQAFYACSALTGELTMPATLATIESGAFTNCTGLSSIFISRTETTTFGRDFFPNNAEGFICYVPLNQFYDFYSKMKTSSYSNYPTTAPSKLLPWVKPTTQWTPISVPVDDSVLLPATGDFYTADQFDLATRSLVLGKLSNDVGIAGHTGMLLKGTVGTVYRFRPKTAVAPYIFYTPNKDYLKGVTGASQTLGYTSSGPWNYTFNGSDRFNRVTSSQTINSGSAYVQLAASDVGPINVSTVYIEDNSMHYNLWINGVQVNSLNYNNLSFIDGVEGTVTYTPSTNTLKLSNATITSNTTDNIRNEISGLKITVTGTNTIQTTAGNNSPLNVKESLSISGSGTINCIGDTYYGCGVTTGRTLTLSGGVQALFRGKYYGIYGGTSTCRLVMSGANTKLTAYGRINASIIRMQPTLSDGLTITEPAGAYFNSDGTVVSASGSTIYNRNVVISKSATLRGDVDGDGEVAISDVSVLIDYLLTGNASSINIQAADCDNDGEVAISDVSLLIDYLLTGNW